MSESLLKIREFTGTAEDYETLARITNVVWPKYPVPADEFRSSDTRRKPEFVGRRFFAEQGKEVVAVGSFHQRADMYHPQRFWVNINVLPDYRNHGVGSQLYDAILAVLQADYHANELHASTTEDRADSLRFLQKRGFIESQREWDSRLNTADFDFSRFSDFDARMQAAGIEIKPLNELLRDDPDCLRQVYELHQTVAYDAPGPVARNRMDFEDWHGGYSDGNPAFIPQAIFMAMHQGDYVGLTSLWGDLSAPKLIVGLTGVRREYRRQGIATALKLRSINYARSLGDRVLLAGNESDNPMLQLNLSLGFVKESVLVLFMKTI